jgi:hypothetical protein
MQLDETVPSESARTPRDHRGCNVTRHHADLRPHPSYLRHNVVVPPSTLTALHAQGERAFRGPITTTSTRVIVDGYARWEQAGVQGRATLACLEYDLAEEAALPWLILENFARCDHFWAGEDGC